MSKLPIALQVYSIREDAAKDFRKTMQEVKEMGYDGVELAGLYDHSPEEVRDILKEVGLIPISAHVAYLEFMADIPATVQRYKTVGCKYAVIPFLTQEYRYGTDKFQEVMANIPKIAEECRKAGLTLLYHNHDFEFIQMEDGRYVLDYMYQELSKEILETEIDTCWVKFAGVDPVEYIKKYEGRSPIVHLKDFTKNPEFSFKPVGYGIQEFPAILEEALVAKSEWVVVEQDQHPERTALEDAKLSIDYLRTLRW